MKSFVKVIRRCGHEEYFDTFYESGSKNWKAQEWKEKGRLCVECRTNDAKARQDFAAQTWRDSFPPPPKWEFISIRQLNFAESSWALALGSVPPEHPGLYELKTFAQEVSGQPLSARNWLDGWTEVMRDWPFEPGTARWIEGKKIGRWLDMKVFIEFVRKGA